MCSNLRLLFFRRVCRIRIEFVHTGDGGAARIDGAELTLSLPPAMAFLALGAIKIEQGVRRIRYWQAVHHEGHLWKAEGPREVHAFVQGKAGPLAGGAGRFLAMLERQGAEDWLR